MLEGIHIINAIYQLFIFAILVGIISVIISSIKRSSENKKRLTRLEEKIDEILKKIDSRSE
jgi:hypothetical protein